MTTKLEKPESSDDQKPYFEMESAARDKLFSSASRIGVGTAENTIIQLLGKPDLNDCATPDKTNAKPARRILYYTRQWRKNTVNEFEDSYVAFIIDDQSRSVTKILFKDRRISWESTTQKAQL